MSIAEMIYLMKTDLYRIRGRCRLIDAFWALFFHEMFILNVVLRACTYLSSRKLTRYTLFPFVWFFWRRLQFKLGIRFSYKCRVGTGLFFGHYGGVNVNAATIIGNNINISQQVTIGSSNRGDRMGVATIGDNVYIGPGARIVGNVKIGNNVAIGANCVVTKDVPDDAVVVGVPGKIISKKGSYGYVNRTDYLPRKTNR